MSTSLVVPGGREWASLGRAARRSTFGLAWQPWHRGGGARLFGGARSIVRGEAHVGDEAALATTRLRGGQRAVERVAGPGGVHHRRFVGRHAVERQFVAAALVLAV